MTVLEQNVARRWAFPRTAPKVDRRVLAMYHAATIGLGRPISEMRGFRHCEVGAGIRSGAAVEFTRVLEHTGGE